MRLHGSHSSFFGGRGAHQNEMSYGLGEFTLPKLIKEFAISFHAGLQHGTAWQAFSPPRKAAVEVANSSLQPLSDTHYSC